MAKLQGGTSIYGLLSTTGVMHASGCNLTGNLRVAAGTSTSVPILFQAGAITTSLTAHAMEWDGTQLYNTTSSFIRRKVSYADETVTVFSATPANSATNIFYTDTQEIHFYTLSATNNFVVDVSGNSTTPYNNVATTNSSRTICVINTSGPIAYVPTLKIDGATQTIKWQGNQSTGNSNALDVWTFTIIKTGVSAYTILGSVTMYM